MWKSTKSFCLYTVIIEKIIECIFPILIFSLYLTLFISKHSNNLCKMTYKGYSTLGGTSCRKKYQNQERKSEWNYDIDLSGYF